MRTTRIILADDHRILTEALVSLLKESFDLVGIVRDGQTLIDEVLRLEPDVVVFDIFMPLLNGLDALRQLRSKGNQTKVVFLTMRTDVAHAVEAFRAGASGFVSKESAGEELIHAITEALHDRLYITPPVGKDWLSVPLGDGGNPSPSGEARLVSRGRLRYYRVGSPTTSDLNVHRVGVPKYRKAGFPESKN